MRLSCSLMRCHTLAMPKTSIAAHAARTTCTALAPVSSIARNTNVMPAMFSSRLQVTVLTIWVRSGCAPSASPKRSASAGGK